MLKQHVAGGDSTSMSRWRAVSILDAGRGPWAVYNKRRHGTDLDMRTALNDLSQC